MAATSQQAFVMAAIDMDGVEVGRDGDGNITAARDLTDDQIELDDVLDLADEHNLDTVNIVTDMQSAETRVVFTGGESA